MKEIIRSSAPEHFWRNILITFTTCALFGRLSAIAQPQNDLSIQIVPKQDTSGRFFLPRGESFEVRLSNHSTNSVLVWDTECEFGHDELFFRTKGQGENSETVQQRSVEKSVWTNFPPKTVDVLAGKEYSFRVNLSEFFWGERAWVNPPEPNTGREVEITAVFEITPIKGQLAQHIWSGHIESAPLGVLILNPKLKTPQDYLWKAGAQFA